MDDVLEKILQYHQMRAAIDYFSDQCALIFGECTLPPEKDNVIEYRAREFLDRKISEMEYDLGYRLGVRKP